jgi:hypothetical protein
VTLNGRGNFEFAGDLGRERVVVELEPTITADLPSGCTQAAVLEMPGRIQIAARESTVRVKPVWSTTAIRSAFAITSC